jgi:hypothetical protein
VAIHDVMLALFTWNLVTAQTRTPQHRAQAASREYGARAE